MVVRFGQFIPAGQAVETTEVVSQLDPRFRKVWPGMAGNRFASVRNSRMLVVRFDSDQARISLARAGVRRSEPTSAGCTVTPQRTLRATRLAGQVRGAAGMAAERGTGTDRTGKRRGQQVRIYPCWKLNLAYLRNPHRKSNMQWISFKQKNYHLEKSVPVL